MKQRRPMDCITLILQSCPSENGAAALAMVLSYYGKPVTMGELTGQPIASAADLVSAAQSRGICAQGYRMSFQQLSEAPLPLIAHWKFRSFVVVTDIRGGKVYVNSPEEGCLVLSRRDFEEGFTGVAICFAADASEQKQVTDRPMRELLPKGTAVPVLLAAAQLFIAVTYVGLAILARSVAAQLSSPQTGGGLSLCLKLGAVILLQGAAVAFQVWLIKRCKTLYRAQNYRSFRERLDRENAAFFQKTSYFRLYEAAKGYGAEPTAMSRCAVCFMQLVSGVVCLVVMAIQEPVTAVVAVLVEAVFCAGCLRRCGTLYSDGKLSSRAEFSTEDLLVQDLRDWEKNRLRGEDGISFQNWADEAGSAYRPMEMERQKAYWYVAAAGELLLVFGVCLLNMIAGYANTEDLLGCLMLAAAAAASMGALPCFLMEQMAIKRFQESTAEVFQGEPDDHALSGDEVAKTLTVQNVSLRPAGDGRDPVKDVTFTVHQGEILVVTGDSDIRAALAAIVSGLERPTQGELYLDNRNAADLSDWEICENIMLLGNGIPFPHGTVRENIAAGFSGITDYAVMEAASDAMLHQSILRHASGYDTPVSMLSSGERVLLEFARAFARGTPFLICNGLTECLDKETEDRLIRNLRRRGVGTVLLTGDMTLLGKGDIAYRIENGRTALRERKEFVEGEVYSLV